MVAQAYTTEGTPELILVHVEVQTQRRSVFAYRMWEYYALLRLRYRQPVFPIVLYLARGAGGLVEETYNESLWGFETLLFRYKAIGLPDLAASDYVEQPNPLGSALSALMRSNEGQRVTRRLRIMQQRAFLQTDDARRTLLMALISAYLPLGAEEQQEFDRLLSQNEFAEVQKVITEYEARGIKIGIKQGIERGREQGVTQGKRSVLLRLMRVRFGELPAEIAARVEAVRSEAQLDALSEQVLTAPTLEAMQIPALPADVQD